MKYSYPEKTAYRRRALLLALLLAFVAIGSLLWIALHATDSETHKQNMLIADIYQDGSLLQSIALSNVEEAYRFTVTGDNGSVNEIEVRQGSIGILSASCPDKLCVHQGFISNSLLPITCLPNRLVIQIRMETSDIELPDMITY
ncbi:MAG: NusG domain II-containing protein [Lachnospiraceae bacterium]|nr:NusG domain II-containing protein [Lachnospiraceae bacterium]